MLDSISINRSKNYLPIILCLIAIVLLLTPWVRIEGSDLFFERNTFSVFSVSNILKEIRNSVWDLFGMHISFADTIELFNDLDLSSLIIPVFGILIGIPIMIALYLIALIQYVWKDNQDMFFVASMLSSVIAFIIIFSTIPSNLSPLASMTAWAWIFFALTIANLVVFVTNAEFYLRPNQG